MTRSEDLDKMLGIDWNDPAMRAARDMLASRRTLAAYLRDAQAERGMSDLDVVRETGLNTYTLQMLTYQGVGSLEDLTRVALAVGVTVTFKVETWPVRPADGPAEAGGTPGLTEPS